MRWGSWSTSSLSRYACYPVNILLYGSTICVCHFGALGYAHVFQKTFRKEITIYLIGRQWQRNCNNLSSVAHPREVSLSTAFCGALVWFCSCYTVDFVVRRAAYLCHPGCCLAWGDVLYFLLWLMIEVGGNCWIYLQVWRYAG